MPGFYSAGEYDVAGCIVGVVDRRNIIDGKKIRPGDVILGLPSNGLHTNGYSLARKILFGKMLIETIVSGLPGLRATVGEELMRTHKNYQKTLAGEVCRRTGLLGLAHITGGGLIDNLPRILPKNCDAVIDTKSWQLPANFFPASGKWKDRSRGNVSSLQHGNRNGGDCRGAKCTKDNVDFKTRSELAGSSRGIWQSAFEILIPRNDGLGSR